MAAGKRFRGVRNFSAGGCRQLFPGCAWLPAKSTAAAGITWAAARPMAAADCRDVRPMGAEDPRWTCDSCCGMRPCDSCCLGQRSIAPGRRARPRHRLAAVSGRAAGAARPGRGSVSRTPSRCPECRQVPASTSLQFTAVSRQSQSPCCQQPSPSERFILTQGNARLLLATPGKLRCLAVAGVWPATAIFSLVPRLPYWPQSELLCWHGLCPWSKLLTHSFISTDMHFSYLTILLSCESPQHISGR